MISMWKIIGILFAVAALVCFGVCIFRGDTRRWLLPLGLALNSVAFVIFVVITR